MSKIKSLSLLFYIQQVLKIRVRVRVRVRVRIMFQDDVAVINRFYNIKCLF